MTWTNPRVYGNRRLDEGWTGSANVELGERIKEMAELFNDFMYKHAMDPNAEPYVSQTYGGDPVGPHEYPAILTDDGAMDNLWVLEAMTMDFLEYYKTTSHAIRDGRDYREFLKDRKLSTPSDYMPTKYNTDRNKDIE